MGSPAFVNERDRAPGADSGPQSLGFLRGLAIVSASCPISPGSQRELWQSNNGAGTLVPCSRIRYKPAEGEAGFIDRSPSGCELSKDSEVRRILSVYPYCHGSLSRGVYRNDPTLHISVCFESSMIAVQQRI